MNFKIEQINFRFNDKSYGFRSGPRGQIIFVENLPRGEYQRISSYNNKEDGQAFVCQDVSKWIRAEIGEDTLTMEDRVAMIRKVADLLEPFYGKEN